jgi:glycosyltransferase involved in cell wall biosynthesis
MPGMTRADRLDPLAAEIFLRRAALACPRSAILPNLVAAAERWSHIADRLQRYETFEPNAERTKEADRAASGMPRSETDEGAAGVRPNLWMDGVGLHSHLLQPPQAARSPAPATLHHAFRLASAAALPTTSSRVFRALDLDDLESPTARAIARLARRAGDNAIAAFYEAAATRISQLEYLHIQRFDRVFVGSPADAEWLAAHHATADIRILPNVVDVPPLPCRPRRSGPFRLLFVGALDYYPNIDALRRLTDGILPALASIRPGSFELHVVGRGGPAWLHKRLGRSPGTVVHGAAPSMTPHLEAADALIAPIGAGGGTRIKLLEAFAAGIPVITSRIGAAGLAVTHGDHLLIAEENEEFIETCRACIDDPEGIRPLATRAHQFVTNHHHPTAFTDAITRP